MLVETVVGIFAICWIFSPTAIANPVEAACTITEYSQVANAVKNCKDITIGNLNVPAGETLYLNPQTGSTLRFEGTIKFGFKNWDGPLVRIQGSQLKGFGSPGSVFDGEGSKYWDGKGGQGTKKPVLLAVNIDGGEFHDFNLKNCPERCAAILGSNILLDGWKIDVSAAGSQGVNTDGFDVVGQYITIKDSSVANQDDCIVVNRGSNMYFQNIHCSGGHGLSLAVGMDSNNYENNVVSNITYEDCTITNSINGIHVKTVKGGGPGLIDNITYKRITLEGVTQYGIRIHQDYPLNDEKPQGNVPIKGLKISSVKGTMSGQFTRSVNVICASGACSDWTWSDIKVTGNNYPCSMNYEPSGFSC